MLRRLLRLYLADPLEAFGVWLALKVFRQMPIDRASAVGGFLGRLLGPKLGVSRVAETNLARAFPEMSPEGRRRVLHGMWDNLGRVATEYAHLDKIQIYGGDGRVDVVGAENVARLRDDGVGGIFFSAHFGNWEIASMGATQRGMPITHIYRAANNRLIERMLRRTRSVIEGSHHPKGAEGAKTLIKALARGEHLGMVVDQKMNDGIPVPFFGRDAMTAPALAQLALKFRCPVVPVRVDRLEGARFRLTVFSPMDLPNSGDRQADAVETMRRVNALFESWIRARPEQWLWVHRRWPD
ncbi:MAG: lipid A biosynthesis lauroyl acyltransferase [Alphaproteobacteria bacterium]